MQEIQKEFAILASLVDTVLILGARGTGKELVAKVLAEKGRPRKPFLALNCSSLGKDIDESELFGHVKGAFTGAVRDSPGILREAGNGTVLLDEIGDMPKKTQAKMLRVLQDHLVRPVGQAAELKIKSRILLATNQDMTQLLESGQFRHDLWDRISTFIIQLPLLKDRGFDIILLARHFLLEFNRERETQLELLPEHLDLLLRHSWPGNVRQLKSVIRKAAAYTYEVKGGIDTVTLMTALGGVRTPTNVTGGFSIDPEKETWDVVRTRVERLYFRKLMTHTHGDKKKAEQLSGMSRATLYNKLKTLKPEED